MESYKNESANTGKHLFELQVDQQGISYLSETARWAKFLSIVGFVICGLMLVAALFAGSLMASFSRFGRGDAMQGAMGMGGAFFSLIYIVITLLCFFPCLYLYNFSGKLQHALSNNDQTSLNISFSHLKSCLKFIGILTIVILSFYALAVLAVVSVSSMMR
jgi:hypothetical protein